MSTLSSDELVAALEAVGLSGVDRSARRRAEYSSDASLYRVVPEVVAFPRAAEEIEAALAVCRELGNPLVVRGAGTSIAGNAIGTGLVLDVSRHLSGIRAIDPDLQTAVVEPGVVLDDLQRAAAAHGLRFGPDPSTHNRCTVGGMIGNNACGSRALGYGRTSDNVISLDVLTGGGERIVVRSGAESDQSSALDALRGVVGARLGVIRTELGQLSRQVSGYALEHLLPERGFDVARALVGTEGTCAITLGATLRLTPAPDATRLVVLGYRDMAAAADAVPAVIAYRPVALEGLDSRIVDVVRATRGGGSVPPLPRGQGWLFVELAGTSGAELEAIVPGLARAAEPVDWRVVTDRSETARLWRIREDGAGLAARPRREFRAHAGWEDAAVPPARLGAYLREFDELLAEHALTGVPYGHFGDGCVHVRIDFPLGEPGGRSGPGPFRRFLLEAASLVAAHGGSMSGEHGDGRARSELLPIMYSPGALAAFADVKAVFDPDDVLNPGVVVRPAALDMDLRLLAVPRIRAGLAFGYHDDRDDFTRAVHRCTGVGKCRADLSADGGVMCPSYLATRDEKDSTRGRARVLQEMANGSLVDGWRSPAVHDALDLCLSCKGCASDCPTGVDMATYKAEVLHQTYRRRLRPASHYVLGWLPRWSRLASRAPRLANRLVRSPLARPGKRLAGVDPRRDLPAFSEVSFRQWFDRQPAGSGDPLLLWIDTFTEHFSPEVGIAAVRVLAAAGFAVQIPAEQLCCGLTWISTGQLDAARRILRRSAAGLATAVAAGIPVVGLEPSCVAAFRGDAAHLVGIDSTAARVGASIRTLAEVLAARTGWSAPDLTGIEVLAQPHCHHHAVMGWATDQALLERAGATVRRVGGCCGLAGNFGAERGHYDVSVAVAETALLPAVRDAGADAVVLTDGFSCRVQLDQLAGRRGLHLAQLLDAGSAGITSERPRSRPTLSGRGRR